MGKGKKGLAVVQQIVRSRAVRAMLIFLLGIVSPMRREFGMAMSARKTKWGLRAWQHKMCTGELANLVMKEICAVNQDNNFAQRMGLSPNLGRNVSEFDLATQGAIARDCESLHRSLLKREHEFFYFYQRMPFLRWAGLHHPSKDVVEQTLLWSQNLWSSLYKAETLCWEGEEWLGEWCKEVLFSIWQREIFDGLSEGTWAMPIPSDVLKEDMGAMTDRAQQKM